MKNYDVMIYGQVSFYHSVKNKTRKSDSIRNISTGRGHDCKTGGLLYGTYFKEKYKLILIYLTKQQVLDGVPKVMQLNNFAGNLKRAENTAMFFIIEEVKETTFYFSQGTVKVL